MSSVIPSKWCKPLLLFALVLFTAQCGDESEVIIQDLDCPGLEGFEGGDYSFTVNIGDIVDGCAGGAFNGLIYAGPYGPVTLPSAAALAESSQEITMELPFVGVVTGMLSLTESFLRLTVEDPILVDDVDLPFIGAVDVTVRVSGTLCPISATRVDAAFNVTVESIQPSIPLITPPCIIGVPATGMLQ